MKDCKKRVKKLLKLQENSSQPSMLDEKTDSVSIDVEVINMESKIGKGKGEQKIIKYLGMFFIKGKKGPLMQ